MGKGFQNFMSKKDFHPSAIWNLEKVYRAHKKAELDKKKQDDLRAQYDKEQEVLNNKALLGDEKARLGLAFMYELPTGIKKDESEMKPGLEPKFEWQRKYNAPREEWAKGDESINDQPFGIQVKNVRCVKCHTWGHVNTDRECPLYNMSGTKEEPGFSTNPSELIKEARRKKQYTVEPVPDPSVVPGTSGASSAPIREKIDNEELMKDMKSEYGLALKNHIVNDLRIDKAMEKFGKSEVSRMKATNFDDWFSSLDDQDQQRAMFQFLQNLSEKERSKIFRKFFKKSEAVDDAKKEVKTKGHQKTPKRKRSFSSSSETSSASDASVDKKPATSNGDKPRYQQSQKRDNFKSEKYEYNRSVPYGDNRRFVGNRSTRRSRSRSYDRSSRRR